MLAEMSVVTTRADVSLQLLEGLESAISGHSTYDALPLLESGSIHVCRRSYSFSSGSRVRLGSFGLPLFLWTPKLERCWRQEVFYDEAEAIQAFQFRVQT